jgi:hypothetical protein
MSKRAARALALSLVSAVSSPAWAHQLTGLGAGDAHLGARNLRPPRRRVSRSNIREALGVIR